MQKDLLSSNSCFNEVVVGCHRRNLSKSYRHYLKADWKEGKVIIRSFVRSHCLTMYLLKLQLLTHQTLNKNTFELTFPFLRPFQRISSHLKRKE